MLSIINLLSSYASNKLYSNTELDDDRLGPDLPVNVNSTLLNLLIIIYMFFLK